MGMDPTEELEVSDGIPLYPILMSQQFPLILDQAVGEVVAVPMTAQVVVVVILEELAGQITETGAVAAVPTTQELNKSFLPGQIMDMVR